MPRQLQRDVPLVLIATSPREGYAIVRTTDDAQPFYVDVVRRRTQPLEPNALVRLHQSDAALQLRDAEFSSLGPLLDSLAKEGRRLWRIEAQRDLAAARELQATELVGVLESDLLTNQQRDIADRILVVDATTASQRDRSTTPGCEIRTRSGIVEALVGARAHASVALKAAGVRCSTARPKTSRWVPRRSNAQVRYAWTGTPTARQVAMMPSRTHAR